MLTTLILIFIILLSFLIYSLYKPRSTMIKDTYNNQIIHQPILTLDNALDTISNMDNNNNDPTFGNPTFGKLDKRVRFIPGTLTTAIKEKINCILVPIINYVNELTTMDFIVMEYNTVLIELDIEKNFKLDIDFFIYNKRDHNSKTRIVCNIIVDDSDNKYINYIHRYNDNGDLNVSLLNHTELEHSLIKNYKNLRINPYFIRNKWIPPNKLTNMNPFPCNKIYNIWDTNGIKYIKKNGKRCYGINSSAGKRNVLPYQNPTIHALPRDNLGLLGLFDLSVGIPINTAHGISGHRPKN